MKAKVFVTLKAAVLDPQGKAVKNALNSLGYEDVEEVRVGKYIEITLAGNNLAKAKERVEAMSNKLLANTVIEDFRYEIE